MTLSFVARAVCIATLFVENGLWYLLVICVLGINVHVCAKTRVWEEKGLKQKSSEERREERDREEEKKRRGGEAHKIWRPGRQSDP